MAFAGLLSKYLAADVGSVLALLKKGLCFSDIQAAAPVNGDAGAHQVVVVAVGAAAELVGDAVVVASNQD